VPAITCDRSPRRPPGPDSGAIGTMDPLQAAIDHFSHSRARLIEHIRTSDAEFCSHFEIQRAAGLIDAFQWALLASGHVRRHTDQILQVKADACFPRSWIPWHQGTT